MNSNAIMSLFLVLVYYNFQSTVYGNGDPDRVRKLREVLEGVTFHEDKASVIIDKDHLKSSPECGYLPDKTKNAHGSSRIANARESDQHYPWMILIKRDNAVDKISGIGASYCGGAIISQTVAITAAHCICGSDKDTPDHLRQFTDCASGSHRTATNPLNEIRRKQDTQYHNEIIAGVGDKDKRRLIEIDIPIAYVMGDTFIYGEMTTSDVFDIGLVMTKDKSRNGKRFYTHTTPEGDIKVGSLCLAAKKDTHPHMYEGQIVTVGWGIRYSEVKDPTSIGGTKPQSNNHSCTTNEFGPRHGVLQHCNVDHVEWTIRNGCRRKEMPNGYDAKKCDKYSKQAEKAIKREVNKMRDSTISDLWTLTNKFEIIPSKKRKRIGFGSKIRRICYKSILFLDPGWCYVDDDNGHRTNQWGFCGSSCDFLGQSGSTSPNYYHKMVWGFPRVAPAKCKLPYIRGRPIPHDSNYFKPWYICVVSPAPSTSVFTFKENPFGRLNFRSAEKEDTTESGYKQPCFGDSGSGHFMRETKKKKWALVAIHSYGMGDYCGFDSHAITTAHPRVLEWIKLHSHIPKSP